MINYFQRSSENPFHISIGGVVVNDEGKICCHYFESKSHPAIGDIKNVYILMRETIEPNETIEECLTRGLQEEFGMVGTLKSYLGSIVVNFEHRGQIVEKTTLYFLCDYISIDPSNRKSEDPESDSEIVWIEPKELIEKMKEQRIRLGREDVDESKILERLVK
jgi:hypothetical protein